MKNLKVKNKLMASFAIMLILAAIIGAFGIITSLMFIGKVDELHSLNSENEGIVRVTEAHYVWRHNLVTAAATGEEFRGSIDPDGCALGTWLKGDVARGIEDSEVLRLLADVAAPHAFIHREAQGVIGHINNGDLEAAKSLVYDTILPRTQEVIDILNNAEERYAELIEELDNEIKALSIVVVTITSVVLGVAVVAAVGLAIYISGMISTPLKAFSAYMEKAGTKGDIRLEAVDIEIIGKWVQIRDEIGTAIKNTASFVEHITAVSERMAAVAGGDLTVDINIL